MKNQSGKSVKKTKEEIAEERLRKAEADLIAAHAEKRINDELKFLFKLTRLRSGLDQAQFAARLGVTQSAISKIEAEVKSMVPSAILYLTLLREFSLEGLKV